jgi:ADP-dependent NAD(P)H-hydrate dehydratase / NAD(P)H-hydrate epimerase
LRIIGRAEQQAIDRLWQQKTGLPLLLLMEGAAWAVSRVCQQSFASLAAECSSAGRILVLAGKGQNGGDALACTRLLGAAGLPVVCRDVFADEAADKSNNLPPEASLNRQALISLGYQLGKPAESDFADLGRGSIIIDGIFGTGFRASRPLPAAAQEVSRLVAAARERGALVLAIDVPSGLDADSGAVAQGAVQADVTVTFVRSKTGLCASPGRYIAGRVIIDSIGVPDELAEAAIGQVRQQTGQNPCYQTDAAEIRALCPKRPLDSHKGLFGKVLLLGGSPGMPGAILLAAEAAARSGAGLVYLGVPETSAAAILAARPEILLTGLPESLPDPACYQPIIAKLAQGQSAVAAGPGAGQAAWLDEALKYLIIRARQLVLDADALNHMAARMDDYLTLIHERVQRYGLPPAILTPHPGEFRRLAPDILLDDRQRAAEQLAARSQCIVVLKGASTVVAEPDGPVWINPTGNQGLARGGSGDVLCGLITSLLGQGLTAGDAAVAGVYLHGLAADIAAAEMSRLAMLPGDVIACLGEAFRQAGWENTEQEN